MNAPRKKPWSKTLLANERFLSMSVLLQAVTGVMTSRLMTVFAIYAFNALRLGSRLAASR